MVIKDKFCRWEWISKLQRIDLELTSPRDIKELFYESATHFDIELEFFNLGYDLVKHDSMRMITWNKKVVPVLDKIKIKSGELLKFMHLLKKQSHPNVTTSLTWDSKSHAIFSNEAESPEINSHIKTITLIGKKTIHEEGTAHKPEEIFQLKLQGIFQPLLKDIEHINLSMFSKCMECGEVYFHWRKRKRKYCSKICQNRAGVNRHRKK